MVKSNINIVDAPILYNILLEIKDNLPFNIKNHITTEDFLKFFNENKLNVKNQFIITSLNNKDFFLNKIKKNLKNIFFLHKQNTELSDENHIFIKYPIDINNFIEKINIQLIKNKFEFQSKITVNNYTLDLNSRTMSNENKTLKLTEREMDIIIFLNENKKPQKINDLQSKVWDYSSELETHTVETHVYRLRKKISEKFNDENFLISTDDGYFIK
mgnify:CR=1 FL=1